MASISAFKAALPDLTDIISNDDFFGSAKRKFPLYMSDGIYEQREKKSIYIYRIQRGHRSHTGILACVNIQDILTGKIKKHENTLEAKEQKMMRLVRERNALIKPVLLTYPNVLSIDAFINRYCILHPVDLEVPFQGEVHQFWELNHEHDIETLQQFFEQKVPTAYICDGHHRVKTAENIYQADKAKNPDHKGDESYNSMLVAYFPASEIEVHNYNRLLLSLKEETRESFLQKLEQYFDVRPSEQAVTPKQRHCVGLCLQGEWYRLRLRDMYLAQADQCLKDSLNASIVNKYILEEVLKIADVRTEVELKYMEGPKGTEGLVDKIEQGKAVAALNLYPVGLEEFIGISDQNGTLPPKSTWIEPRMRNGFIAQLYTDI